MPHENGPDIVRALLHCDILIPSGWGVGSDAVPQVTNKIVFMLGWYPFSRLVSPTLNENKIRCPVTKTMKRKYAYRK